ncbi:ATP-binding protein [Streptomyces olivochromogenes]|uniref:ATP-binding protein n=1 Tax=Streptomyces olivochromogenes TaxID=1963 RepID=UPI0036DAB0DC
MTHPTPTTAGPLAPTVGAAQTGADVALYTTTVNSRVAAVTLAALADVATRQGWTIVHQAYDLTPLHVPARLRTGWRTVAQLLDTGRAAGLVVPAEHEIARTPSEQNALRAWLLRIPAFAVYPHARHHGPPPAPAGATPFLEPGAPVDRAWSRSYALTPASLRGLRDAARMYLTVLRWPGDIPTAVEVLSRLAHNAVIHARPDTESEADGKMTVRLAVAENNVLLVDVEDPRPEFPDSKAAIEGEKGRGLMYVRLLSAQVTWYLSEDARTKTVQARLPDTSA